MSTTQHPPDQTYWALIGDLVHSRRIGNRARFQRRFEAAVEALNQELAGSLAARGIITTGDEVQFLFWSADPLPPAVEALTQRLSPHPIRFGVGYGTLSTELKPEAVGMDGPVWHSARFALEKAREERKLVAVARDLDLSGEGRRREALAAPTDAWNLALHVIAVRTPKQQEVCRLYDELELQKRVAEHLGVNRSVVSRHLKKALYAETKAVLRHLPALLEAAVRTDQKAEALRPRE